MREDFVPGIPYLARILMYVCNKMVVPRDYCCILLCAIKTPFFLKIFSAKWSGIKHFWLIQIMLKLCLGNFDNWSDDSCCANVIQNSNLQKTVWSWISVLVRLDKTIPGFFISRQFNFTLFPPILKCPFWMQTCSQSLRSGPASTSP